MTASAIATTRGSCRAGLVNRVVSGATASHPTNDSISVAAAWPTAGQPWGANGAQLAARAAWAEPATATVTTMTSRPTRRSWAVLLARSPKAARVSTTSSSSPATHACASWPPPVSAVR